MFLSLLIFLFFVYLFGFKKLRKFIHFFWIELERDFILKKVKLKEVLPLAFLKYLL